MGKVECEGRRIYQSPSISALVEIITLKAYILHPPTSLESYYSFASPSDYNVNYVGHGAELVALYARQFGYEVGIVNIPLMMKMMYGKMEGFKRDEYERFFDWLKSRTYEPNIVGIELNWIHQSKGAIQIADMHRKLFPNVPIVLGGLTASACDVEILKKYRFIDAIVRGEGEASFTEILRRREENRDILDVKGVTVRDGDKIVRNDSMYVADIDTLPLRTGVIAPSPSEKEVISPPLITFRGRCPQNCAYCLDNNPEVHPRPFTMHSPEYVLKQVLNFYHDLSARYFDFGMVIPVPALKWVENFCRLVIREKMDNAFFRIETHPAILTRSSVQVLKKANVAQVQIGVESGSESVLRHVGRFVYPSQIESAITNAVQAGIMVDTAWLTGLPDEKVEDLETTYLFLKKLVRLGAISTWINPCWVFPGTKMFATPERYGIVQKMKSFEDFFAFSTETDVRKLITHETEFLSSETILSWTMKLRKAVLGELWKQISKNVESLRGSIPSFYVEGFLKTDRAYLKKRLEKAVF